MSGVIATIGRPAVDSLRRIEFMRAIGEAFDKYVEKYGEEPDALIHVLNGVRQNTSTGWLVQGESEDGITTCLALAVMGLTRAVTVDFPGGLD